MVIGFEFCYATRFYFSMRDNYNNTLPELGPFTENLDTAMDMAQAIIKKFQLSEVVCCSAETGEIIFIARAHEADSVEKI